MMSRVLCLLLLLCVGVCAGADVVKCALDQNSIVSRVNELRTAHSAPLVMWSPDLESVSEDWSSVMADGDFFTHSNFWYGENLALTSIGRNVVVSDCTVHVLSSIQLWYNEVGNYNFTLGRFQTNTGHFTQLVWAATKRIGAGVVYNQTSGRVYITMMFDPAGNVAGAFTLNVFSIGAVTWRPPQPPSKATSIRKTKKPVLRRLLKDMTR